MDASGIVSTAGEHPYALGGAGIVIVIVIAVIFVKYRKNHPKLKESGWGDKFDTSFYTHEYDFDDDEDDIALDGSWDPITEADLKDGYKFDPKLIPEDQRGKHPLEEYEGELPDEFTKMLKNPHPPYVFKKLSSPSSEVIHTTKDEEIFVDYYVEIKAPKGEKVIKVATQFQDREPKEYASFVRTLQYFAKQVMTPIVFLLNRYPTFEEKRLYVVLTDDPYTDFSTSVDDNKEQLVIFINFKNYMKATEAKRAIYPDIFHELFHHLDEIKDAYFQMHAHNKALLAELESKSKELITVKKKRAAHPLHMVLNLLNDVLVEKTLIAAAPPLVRKINRRSLLKTQKSRAKRIETKYLKGMIKAKISKYPEADQYFLLTTHFSTHIPVWFAAIFNKNILISLIDGNAGVFNSIQDSYDRKTALYCWNEWKAALSKCTPKVQNAVINYLAALKECVKSIQGAHKPLKTSKGADSNVRIFQYYFADHKKYEKFIKTYAYEFDSLIAG